MKGNKNVYDCVLCTTSPCVLTQSIETFQNISLQQYRSGKVNRLRNLRFPYVTRYEKIWACTTSDARSFRVRPKSIPSIATIQSTDKEKLYIQRDPEWNHQNLLPFPKIYSFFFGCQTWNSNIWHFCFKLFSDMHSAIKNSIFQ